MIEHDFENGLSLFACDRCFDSGVWLTPKRDVITCPQLVLGREHACSTTATDRFQKAAQRYLDRGNEIGNESFAVGAILCGFTTTDPCPRSLLLEFLYGGTNLNDAYKLRKFHGIIELLRKHWLLPIGSRKHDPAGYWMIISIDDYKDWFGRVVAAPKTQLATVYRNARENFPEFANQQKLNLEEAA